MLLRFGDFRNKHSKLRVCKYRIWNLFFFCLTLCNNYCAISHIFGLYFKTNHYFRYTLRRRQEFFTVNIIHIYCCYCCLCYHYFYYSISFTIQRGMYLSAHIIWFYLYNKRKLSVCLS